MYCLFNVGNLTGKSKTRKRKNGNGIAEKRVKGKKAEKRVKGGKAEKRVKGGKAEKRVKSTDLNYWIKLLSCIIEANGGHIGLSHINLHWYY